MTKTDRAFLHELLSTPSPTGFEMPGQRVWARHVGKVADSVDCDAYGNAWAVLNGSGEGGGRRVMIAAHADEIGYMIKHVTDKGFLHLDRIGGSDSATARGRRIDLLGDKGVVRGIIGNTAIHLRENRDDEKAPKIHELYVDVGASNAKEVAELGLRPGHAAVYTDTVEDLGDHRVCGRALDNRIGGFILALVMAKLAGGRKRCPATMIALNTVQEEIGGHGAKMATHRLQPDVAICIDVTHATDTPGIEHAKHGKVELGAGPSVTHGTSSHPLVVERIVKVAAKRKIPLQHESSSRFSGTDTDEIFKVRHGVPSGLVSLPLRYMHSVVETADLRDLEHMVDLLAGFVQSITDHEEFRQRLD